ncbi:zeta toxin family protein [uncultured Microbacterium sp.]|uniref:zeta toxin family protein n=1 Tax=uncultured Microbacterium sp. TaxID=191216 RepID=UPI000C4DDF1D|nr:zeta toxin family protein [uncultured Microbacterium sp.]MAM53965.1 hypothetical protein [Microbacterium sp.]
MNPGDESNLNFESRIAPLLFAPKTREDDPSFTVITGQPGAGKAYALSTLLRTADTRSAVVSSESLAAFHPDYLQLRRQRPLEAQAAMAPLVADWLSRSLDYARSERRSLVLLGSFGNPAAVLGTVEGFSEDAFNTRVVVVAARRPESLLATTSRHLEMRRRGLPSIPADLEAHDRGWGGARELVDETESTHQVGRFTIVAHGGQLLFDQDDTAGFYGASAAIDAYDSSPVTTLQGAEWFGELRRVTDYARETRETAPPVVRTLVALHELALSEVLPRMNVRPQSSFYLEQEARLSDDLAQLRGLAHEQAAELHEPALVVEPITPSSRGPSI